MLLRLPVDHVELPPGIREKRRAHGWLFNDSANLKKAVS
jgi:hypothetical protein